MPIGFEGASRFAELLRRVFGVGAEEVTPPGIILEADRPEWAYHKREVRKAHAHILVAGIAGTYNHIQLYNPAGSGALITVHRTIVVVKSDTLPALISRYDTALTLVAAPARVSLDTRWPMTAGKAEIRFVQDANALLGVGWHMELGAIMLNGWGVWAARDPVVLAPGSGLLTQTPEDASDLRTTFVFAERRAQPEELAD